VRIDRELVLRVEAASARQAAHVAEVLASRSPHTNASAEWIDGSAFVSLGAGRYVNRALCFGLGHASAAVAFDALETFFGSRSLPASAEVSPWVPDDVVAEARARGYGVDWFRNVYAHDLVDLPPRSTGFEIPPSVEIEEVTAATYEAWREILSGESPLGSGPRAISDEFCDAQHRVPGATDLVACVDGEPAATGSLAVDGDVATLGGAATRVAARGRGLQRALIADRLHRARGAGARLAIVTAMPAAQSARNLVATGFQLLYTQVVLTQVVVTRAPR
jgi:GNAT superfamily N-acetyltransferase